MLLTPGSQRLGTASGSQNVKEHKAQCEFTVFFSRINLEEREKLSFVLFTEPFKSDFS